MAPQSRAVPVIALTGFLGAGKTTLLNHVLRTPGARIGVVINDFGDLNVDAALVTGQIDEPASIAGGCLCCLTDDDALDEALTKLADPALGLDAIIVEASGLADPVAISRIIRYSGADNVRWGGVVDVIDARAHFDTVDRGSVPPARYAAASLVVVNKLDQVPDAERESALARIQARIRELNTDAHIVGVTAGRLPIERGMELTRDDRIRRWVIMELMCNLRVSARRFAELWGEDFHAYFAEELPRLRPFIADGLVNPGLSEEIRVTEMGQIIVRPVAMIFDAYLNFARKAGASTPVFSRTL